MVEHVLGVVPEREPPLPLERAAARQRRGVGVGEPCLQVGAAYAGEQDYRVVDLEPALADSAAAGCFISREVIAKGRRKEQEQQR